MPKTLEERLRQLKDAVLERTSKMRVYVRFAELNDAEKASLKGEKGDQGLKGDTVVGPPGPIGKQGPKGDSIVGPQGPEGKQGPKGDKGDTPEIDKQQIVKEVLENLPLDELERRLTDRDKTFWKRIKELVAKVAQRESKGGGGTFIHVGSSAPSNPSENTLWVDTS